MTGFLVVSICGISGNPFAHIALYCLLCTWPESCAVVSSDTRDKRGLRLLDMINTKQSMITLYSCYTIVFTHFHKTIVMLSV